MSWSTDAGMSSPQTILWAFPSSPRHGQHGHKRPLDFCAQMAALGLGTLRLRCFYMASFFRLRLRSKLPKEPKLLDGLQGLSAGNTNHVLGENMAV